MVLDEFSSSKVSLCPKMVLDDSMSDSKLGCPLSVDSASLSTRVWLAELIVELGRDGTKVFSVAAEALAMVDKLGWKSMYLYLLGMFPFFLYNQKPNPYKPWKIYLETKR